MLANRGYGMVETGLPSVDDLKFLEDVADPVTDIRTFYERTKDTTREVDRRKMRLEATRGDGVDDGHGTHEKIIVYFEEKVG